MLPHLLHIKSWIQSDKINCNTIQLEDNTGKSLTTDAVFIYINMTFDAFNREGLLFKLRTYGSEHKENFTVQ